MKHICYLLVGILLGIFAAQSPTIAQQTSDLKKLKKVTFQPADTSMKIVVNARMQNRLEVSNESSESLAPTQAEFLVRRFRLKSNGYLADPRLTYKLEIAFSKRDVSPALGQWGNNLLDAYVEYQLTDDLEIRFGQGKLPGNRQRVISSGNLQLVDRSPANGDFNLDRDVGLTLFYDKNIGPSLFRYAIALSNGEGRNIVSSRNQLRENELNLAITQRVEFLPFGAFTGGGDYFESDLMREANPKLSVAGGYYYNNDAVRAQGQLGSALFESRNINSVFADFIYKHLGWSVMGEYMQMDSPNPITFFEGEPGPGDNRFSSVRSGKGYMIQAGYLWPSFWEIAARHSEVSPNDKVEAYRDPVTNNILSLQEAESETLLGISKYIRGHNIKVQSDIGYIQAGRDNSENYWRWRLQMEMGF